MDKIPCSDCPPPAGPLNFGQYFRLQFLLALLGVILIGGLRFLLVTGHEARWIILISGYWVTAGMAAGFGFLLWRRWRATDWSWSVCKTHRIGLACIVLCSLFLHAQEKPGYRVLFDEFVINGVAYNMHYERTATYPARAHYVGGRLMVLDAGIDKRPFFFAFLVSLIHDLTGYREANVFFLNAGLAALLLTLVYLLGFRWGGQRTGCLGVLLLTGVPLLALNANGGGFEVLNLVMISGLLLAGQDYLRSPGAQGLDLLLMTALLLAQVRYESMLYVLIVPVLVGWKWLRTRELRLTWFSAGSPLLLLMPLMVNKVFLSLPGYFQTKSGQDPFSVANLPDNLSHAVYYLFDFNFDATSSFFLSALGIVALIFVILLLMRNALSCKNGRADDIVFALILLVILANTALGQFYFWGHWDDPMVSRFSFPLLLLMTLAAMRVGQEFWPNRPPPRFLVFAAAAWIVLVTAPTAGRDAISAGNITSREYAWFHAYLATKSPADTLSVVSSSLAPILQNYAAISFGRARDRKWQLKTCLNGDFYHEILVLQRFEIDQKSGRLIEKGSSTLGDGYVLQTLAETRFRPNLITRISRMVGVKGNPPPPPEYAKEKFPFKDEGALIDHLLRELP